MDVASDTLLHRREQEIFQDFDISRHGFALDLAFTRYVTDVKDRGVREARHLEKAGKVPHVTCPTLRLYLFLQVEGSISAQDLVWLGCGNHQGSKPRSRAVCRRKSGSSAAINGCSV